MGKRARGKKIDRNRPVDAAKAFNACSDMEGPLDNAEAIADLLLVIAGDDGLDPQLSRGVYLLSCMLRESVEKVQDLYGVVWENTWPAVYGNTAEQQ